MYVHNVVHQFIDQIFDMIKIRLALCISVCSLAILCTLATTCEPQSVGVFPSDHRAPQKDQQCFAVEEPKLIDKYMASNSVSLTQVVCVVLKDASHLEPTSRHTRTKLLSSC